MFGNPDPKGGAAEAERQVPTGADRLLSRWPEEHEGQKGSILDVGFLANWQFIYLFRRRDPIQHAEWSSFRQQFVWAGKYH